MTGDDLRDLLRRLGHTQETAADTLGVHRSTVARWLVTDQLTKRAVQQLHQLPPYHRLPQGDEAEVATLLPLVERLLTMEDPA